MTSGEIWLAERDDLLEVLRGCERTNASTSSWPAGSDRGSSSRVRRASRNGSCWVK